MGPTGGSAARAGDALADAIDAALPQTQCTRCGYPDCRGYAHAIAQGEADIDLCPPGGAEGIVRLAGITGRSVRSLDPERGREGPRLLAVIDEERCIGCTLCIKACPVDCIVGASKQMHTVIDALCTGCELCVAPCPVDCIAMVPVTGDRTGWSAWSPAQAAEARERYARHRERIQRDVLENDARLAERARSKLAELELRADLGRAEALDRTRAIIEASLSRSRGKAPG